MGDGLKRARDATRATRGLAPETPKLSEIAERIAAHLRRFEADPEINRYSDERTTRPYFRVDARQAGARVAVLYISYQGSTCLPKTDALAYLAWLDAGNVGRHFEQQRAAREDAS